jgi:hypothetical protein
MRGDADAEVAGALGVDAAVRSPPKPASWGPPGVPGKPFGDGSPPIQEKRYPFGWMPKAKRMRLEEKGAVREEEEAGQRHDDGAAVPERAEGGAVQGTEGGAGELAAVPSGSAAEETAIDVVDDGSAAMDDTSTTASVAETGVDATLTYICTICGDKVADTACHKRSRPHALLQRVYCKPCRAAETRMLRAADKGCRLELQQVKKLRPKEYELQIVRWKTSRLGAGDVGTLVEFTQTLQADISRKATDSTPMLPQQLWEENYKVYSTGAKTDAEAAAAWRYALSSDEVLTETGEDGVVRCAGHIQRVYVNESSLQLTRSLSKRNSDPSETEARQRILDMARTGLTATALSAVAGAVGTTAGVSAGLAGLVDNTDSLSVLATGKAVEADASKTPEERAFMDRQRRFLRRKEVSSLLEKLSVDFQRQKRGVEKFVASTAFTSLANNTEVGVDELTRMVESAQSRCSAAADAVDALAAAAGVEPFEDECRALRSTSDTVEKGLQLCRERVKVMKKKEGKLKRAVGASAASVPRFKMCVTVKAACPQSLSTKLGALASGDAGTIVEWKEDSDRNVPSIMRTVEKFVQDVMEGLESRSKVVEQKLLGVAMTGHPRPVLACLCSASTDKGYQVEGDVFDKFRIMAHQTMATEAHLIDANTAVFLSVARQGQKLSSASEIPLRGSGSVLHFRRGDWCVVLMHSQTRTEYPNKDIQEIYDSVDGRVLYGHMKSGHMVYGHIAEGQVLVVPQAWWPWLLCLSSAGTVVLCPTFFPAALANDKYTAAHVYADTRAAMSLPGLQILNRYIA